MTAIETKYSAAMWLGTTTSEEGDALDGGRYRHYEHGSIYWHPMAAACILTGDILKKYRELRYEWGLLGFPIEDEQDALNSKCQKFMGGVIYSSERLGTYYVHGKILKKWAFNGFERTFIGLPVSDPTYYSEHEIRQQFENGHISSDPQEGTSVHSNNITKHKVIRVFLTEWEDLRHNGHYKRDFFENYFFSNSGGFESPDGDPIPQSIAQYYSGISGGHLSITGAVSDWVTAPYTIMQVPHYTAGVVPQPGVIDVTSATVISALHMLHIYTEEDMAVNGIMPDALVFCCMDLVSGGSTAININYIKYLLYQRELGHLWDTRWDRFGDIPLLHFSCSNTLEPIVITPPMGIFNRRPDNYDVVWAKNSVVPHELGHIFCGNPDMYWREWWGDTFLEVMTGTKYTDHWPQMSAFLKERNGWLDIPALPRLSWGGLNLAPFETTGQAFRLQLGPVGYPEEIILENRTGYNLTVTPPPAVRNGLFAYRNDPEHRLAVDGADRKHSTILWGTHGWGELWGAEWRAPLGGELTASGARLGNTLNYAGECWREFLIIVNESDGSIRFDVAYYAYDLIANYGTAVWKNGRGAVLSGHDAPGSDNGFFTRRLASAPIKDGMCYKSVLNLTGDSESGIIEALYPVPELHNDNGCSMYLTAALAEGAIGAGFEIYVVSHDNIISGRAEVRPGDNIKTLCIDLATHRAVPDLKYKIVIKAHDRLDVDKIYLVEGVIVKWAKGLVKYFDALVSPARWLVNGLIYEPTHWTDDGGMPVSGAVITTHTAAMLNGITYGGPMWILTTSPFNSSVMGVFHSDGALPDGNCVLRGECGFYQNSQPSAGVTLTIMFMSDDVRVTALLVNVLLTIKPISQGKGAENNPVTTFAAVLPDNMRGRSGNFMIMLTAAQPGQYNTVVLRALRLATELGA